MTTNLNVLVNYVDADVLYQTTPADYIVMDLDNDYLIWTAGSAVIKDLMTHEPITSELNAAATIIDPTVDVTVAKCLLMDDSHDVGGPDIYTHLVKGMGDDTKRYSYCFSFDGETATEPQLEAWEDDTHLTFALHVLGNGTPANSFVKASCTTASIPSVSGWNAIAGGSNVLELNDGAGALGSIPSGQITQELYANLKIVIPGGYATPAGETFVLTVRYTWV